MAGVVDRLADTTTGVLGDPASLDELQEHTLIYFVDALERIREIDLHSIVERPRVRFTSTNIFAQVEAARCGVGIALLSRFMAATAPELRPVAAPVRAPRVRVGLAIRKDAMARRELVVVREALHEEVRSRRAELVRDR